MEPEPAHCHTVRETFEDVLRVFRNIYGAQERGAVSSGETWNDYEEAPTWSAA